MHMQISFSNNINNSGHVLSFRSQRFYIVWYRLWRRMTRSLKRQYPKLKIPEKSKIPKFGKKCISFPRASSNEPTYRGSSLSEVNFTFFSCEWIPARLTRWKMSRENSHAPTLYFWGYSKKGLVIFVKLHPFVPDDTGNEIIALTCLCMRNKAFSSPVNGQECS